MSYAKVLYLFLSFGGVLSEEFDKLCALPATKEYFMDLSRSYRQIYVYPPFDECEIDAFLCFVCANETVDKIPERLFQLGRYAENCNYLLQPEVVLNLDICDKLQHVALEYILHKHYQTISFCRFLSSKEYHWMAISQSNNLYRNMLNTMAEVDMLRCFDFLYIHSQFCTLPTVSMLYVMTHGIEEINTVEDITEYFEQPYWRTPQMEFSYGMAKLLAKYTEDKEIATKVWAELKKRNNDSDIIQLINDYRFYTKLTN